ncbi:enoyl-CoA hydratase [Tamilnaduibacter salinus]|uniref:3-hydroxyisobutyryl-CoA hydrolase n=1 Tax=Tamilnaduibacter salinus TaxID=1484056 RepID=A0A2A2I1S4_9GAMM|nr:enoyl-CoA hydratase/isomerase family protein [Tamilnaduibacter salinus]PAV25971.1 enoyl-CoA hydratase [Tamilnaduibacter salinus]
MSIQTETLTCRRGQVGLITLDRPQALNALSTETLNALNACLDDWADHPDIHAVVLRGGGDKGFCAGGDIRELYHDMQKGDPAQTATAYFSNEYRLDHKLHRFPKPVICWAHGIIMGGGLGLLAASRYRVITPDARMAMPEVTIGLFPDVGSGWFLNRMPGSLSLFMGLTGARLNATDALREGLADFALAHTDQDTLLDRLRDIDWTGNVIADDNRLHQLLTTVTNERPATLPESQLALHEQAIARIARRGSLTDIVDAILERESDDGWWQQARSNLANGCPMTPWLVWEHLHRGLQLSLAEVFRMELIMAVRCCEKADFREGIRARVIDKDQSPRWQHASVPEVPRDAVDAFFESPWAEDEHPLADLEG